MSLSHVSIGVRDYTVSKAFYAAVLAPLGFALVYDSEDSNNPSTTPQSTENRTRTLGFGPSADREILNIFETKGGGAAATAPEPGPGFHLAFDAPTRDAVVAFHAASEKFGGRDNGPPGLRSHYGADYFAAFVVDPDGWRLEAVCKEPAPSRS